MMGKEFFGKLLSNRQDKPGPWDRDDPEDGLAAVDLDDAPAPLEEADARRAAGGDGQTSSLPEIQAPATSNVDGSSDTDEPGSHDDQPEERFESNTHSDDTAHTSEVHHDDEVHDLAEDATSNERDEPHAAFDEEASTNPAPADDEGEFKITFTEPDIHHDDVSPASASTSTQNGTDIDRASAREHMASNHGDVVATEDAEHAVDRSAASSPPAAGTAGANADKDSSSSPQAAQATPAPPTRGPATPAPATSAHDDGSAHERGADDGARPTREGGGEYEDRPSMDARSAAETQPAPDARSATESRAAQHAASEQEASLLQDAASEQEAALSQDSASAREASQSQHAASEREAAPAQHVTSEREAAQAQHAYPDQNDTVEGPTAQATPDIAPESEALPAPQATPATEPPRTVNPEAAPPSESPDAHRTAKPAASPQRQQAPQTRTRKESAARTRDRERKEADPPRARPKAPASIQGDAELKGIKDRVVIRLLEKQLVSPTHVKAAMSERNKGSLKATLWRIVAHQKGVDRESIYREAALTYAFVERRLEDSDVDLEFVRQVADVFPEKRRNRLIELRVVPVGYEFEQQTQMLRVVFLTHDPSLPAVRELMQELNLERYELQYAPESAVKDLLAKAFPRKNEYLERMSEDPLAYDLGLSYEDEKGEMIDEEALEAEINRSSLINLFEAALVESVLKGASDIHIYPNARRQVEIHFRIDGRLVLWHIEDKVHPESLLAVIKDNTMNVDRFERDMAQDGFIQRKVDDTLIRYRVSILPIATAQQSLHAESIVIRVLDDRKVITDLSQLGLLKGALDRFDMAIRQPHGMVILTGPTGSGKSTTLVAALHQVVNPEINVLTVEDPVEYIIPGVRQIKLNHKLNLEQALRSILRHDPDVVMVGEMRDRPTAELAIKLANTGHLTFSTLHTNDAPSAVSRLYKMGVEPFLIAYAINLVVAQRLIRSLCASCKVVDSDPDPILLDRLGFTKEDLATTTLYKPSGDPTCKTCKGTGYKGRRAISEALYFSRAIRHMIVEADSKIDEDALREAARKDGMLTLQDSAREVAKMGVTSIDEMMRVTTVEE